MEYKCELCDNYRYKDQECMLGEDKESLCMLTGFMLFERSE